MFDLKGYILDKILNDKNGDILLFCHLQRKSVKFSNQRSYSVCATRKRRIKHQVFEGRLVWIIITQRRFFFVQIDKRLWEPLPNVNSKKQTSNSYRKKTICDLQNASYTHSSFIRKSSPMFAPRLIDELPSINIYWPDDISLISLDGKNIGKHKQLFTLGSPIKNQLLSAIPPMNQRELVATLKSQLTVAQREQIKEACIDMDKFMKAVIVRVFPNANIVIDRFHVIQNALRCFNAYRCRFQKINNLTMGDLKTLVAKPINKLNFSQKQTLFFFLEKYPNLKICYDIIQELRLVYLQKNRQEAKKQLNKVIKLCYESKIFDMIDLAKTLERWYSEILNFYLSHITNGFVEGIHNRFETIKRNHFGIRNTDRFVKRLMYTFIPAPLFVDLLSKVVG